MCEPMPPRALISRTKPRPTSSSPNLQMESYRSLGAHVVEKVLGDADDPDASAPLAALKPYWKHIQKFAA